MKVEFFASVKVSETNIGNTPIHQPDDEHLQPPSSRNLMSAACAVLGLVTPNLLNKDFATVAVSTNLPNTTFTVGTNNKGSLCVYVKRSKQTA